MADSEQELLAAVLSEPEREAPRLRYAEALAQRGDPYGEYIKKAVRLAELERLDTYDPEKWSLSSSLRRLEKEYGSAWAAGVAPLVHRYRFSRGFPEIVTLHARDFLTTGEKVFQIAPVVQVALAGAAGLMREICASPLLERVLALDLSHQKLTDADVMALAESDRLQQLRWLNLKYNSITLAGMEALVASTKLPALRWAGLRGNPGPDLEDRWGQDQGASIFLGSSPEAEILEKKYGRRAWLHWYGPGTGFREPTLSLPLFIGP